MRPPSSLQSLVVSPLPLGEELVFIERQMLREGQRHDAFVRVDLAVSIGGAIPAELANARRHATPAGLDRDLDAQTVTLRRVEGMTFLPQRSEVVGGHELDCLATEQSVAVQRSAIAQH